MFEKQLIFELNFLPAIEQQILDIIKVMYGFMFYNLAFLFNFSIIIGKFPWHFFKNFVKKN